MISVVILTKNSALNIERCLQALTRFPEVSIIDNGSTDNTLEIARRYNNVIIHKHEFCGFGKLKNIGAELAKNDWVFFVDSDEVVQSKLVETILNLKLDDKTVYQFYRKNYYDNLLIDGCSWDNDCVSRLYNRKVTHYNDNQVHESINTSGLKVTKLKEKNGFIYHFPYQNTAGLIIKLEHYAQLYAAHNYGKKQVKVWTIPFRAVLAFFKSYILKRGFMYGCEGMTISAYNAMGVFVKYLKLYELSYRRKLGVAIKLIDNLTDLDQIIDNLNQQNLLAYQAIFLIDDKILAHNYDDIDARLRHRLVIPSRIIRIQKADCEMALSTHLKTNPELNGIILYTNKDELEDRKCLFKARNDLRLKRKSLTGKMFFPQR